MKVLKLIDSWVNQAKIEILGKPLYKGLTTYFSDKRTVHLRFGRMTYSYRFNEVVKRFLGTIGKVHGDNRLESVIECQSFKLINITDTFLDVNHVIVSISSRPCFPVKPVSIDMVVEITSKMEERHCIKGSLDRRYQTVYGEYPPYITGKLSQSLPVL